MYIAITIITSVLIIAVSASSYFIARLNKPVSKDCNHRYKQIGKDVVCDRGIQIGYLYISRCRYCGQYKKEKIVL